MPSPRHDALNELFRENPRLAVDILGRLKALDLPGDLPVQEVKNTFNDRLSVDFTADNAFAVGPPQNPVHGIVLEVQLEPSEEKRKQLPRYKAKLWLDLRCGVDVLVVCPNARTAAYFADPIPTELPDYTLQAVVVGPDDIPVITDPTEAATQPEMAVLSVMAHGRNRKVVEAFMAAAGEMPAAPGTDSHAPQYYEHAYQLAAPAVRKILRELMNSTKWPVYSPFAREHFGRGKAEGRAETAKLMANLVIDVLSTRGFTVPDDTRDRITNCTDIDQLQTWIKRAATADTIDDLFA